MSKITDYPALTAPNNNDLLVIEDTIASATKKITRTNFLKGTALPADTVNTQAITDANVTTAKVADSAITPAKLLAGTGTSWTPTTYTIATLTNAAIGTGGGAVKEIDYVIIGKIVHCRLKIILGTSGQSVGSGLFFTLPVTSATHVVEEALGTVTCADGASGYAATVTWKSTTEVYIRPHASSGTGTLQSGTASTVPFTWGAGDGIHGTFRYRAA